MTLMEYPLFSPPEALASKSHRDWSKKEAQSYFDAPGAAGDAGRHGCQEGAAHRAGA
jgi:hypothetical protein